MPPRGGLTMLSSVLANRLGATAAGALAATGWTIGCDTALAEDRRFDVGLRGVVIIGDGEPSNDMIGYGVLGRWEFRESWHLGVALDSVSFDYETPYRVLGIDSV